MYKRLRSHTKKLYLKRVKSHLFQVRNILETKPSQDIPESSMFIYLNVHTCFK